MTAERLRIALACSGDRFVAEMSKRGPDIEIQVNGGNPMSFSLGQRSTPTSHELLLHQAKTLTRASFARTAEGDLALFISGTTYALKIEPDYATSTAAADVGGAMTAPMPGNIVAVLASVGDNVRAGDPLVVMEAMKMEHKILAAKTGTIAALPYGPGDAVEEQAVVAEINPA